MQIAAGLSFLCVVVASLTVGVRLLLLARRTRKVAELSLGLSLVLLMGVAYPCMIALKADHGLSVEAANTAMLGANALLNMSFWFIFLFTWRAFRPAARWPAAVLVLVAGAMVVNLVLLKQANDTYGTPELALHVTSRLGLIVLGIAITGYTWAGIESILCWSRLRKRQRLGLVDPVLCNRFLLFALMSLFTVVGALANSFYLAASIDVLARPDAMFITSLTGLAQGLFLWLTFLPPDRYSAFIRGRAAQQN